MTMEKIVLHAENLTKHYGPLLAVNQLSLDVREGEVFGFLGPNGAGKTTSINMLCGLLKPDSGRVLIEGQPVTNGSRAARSRVGVCPQNVVLWERLTCLEQLIFIGQMYDVKTSLARQRAEKLLSDLDLKEKRNALAGTLSGGLQRRLNIAMALVHDPAVLVLDEPEAGLDPQSRVLVRDYIHAIARKKTVILTTHNMDEADRVADRVAIIDHGELLVLDEPQKLKQRLGDGDTLEIQLRALPGDQAALAQTLGEWDFDHMLLDTTHYLVRMNILNAAGKLGAILNALQAGGWQPGEASIRANTLEDVFIQLTGRRLRE
jgi:ABC-2 type transport system ATP-binding protein